MARIFICLIKKMYNVKIVKNFLTHDEVKILNKWTLDHYKEPYFSNPYMNEDDHQTRFTTRHACNRTEDYRDYKIKYPKEVYDIQKRLIEFLKIDRGQIVPSPEFNDGIVTTISFPPGSCCEHVDPIYYRNYKHGDDAYTLHCNFITQNSKHGGVTYVEGVPFETEEKDLLMYVASELKHKVTAIEGKTPRILWVFGFCTFEHQLNRIFKPDFFSY
jgi:hypothetical protein